MRQSRPLNLIILFLLLAGFLGWCSPSPAGEKKPAKPLSVRKKTEKTEVKNLIVLIPDGCASEQYTLARWFKGKPLSLDQIRVGAVKTFIAD